MCTDPLRLYEMDFTLTLTLYVSEKRTVTLPSVRPFNKARSAVVTAFTALVTRAASWPTVSRAFV